MYLASVTYSQNVGLFDEWHLKDVQLGKLNLIVGRNAVGKTICINILNALVNMLTSKSPMLINGTWRLTFKQDRTTLTYRLTVKDNKVVREELLSGRKLLIDRQRDSGRILCATDARRRYETYNPPVTKLTNQVRRDVKQHPFVEDLVTWAEHYHAFTFSVVTPELMAS